MTRPGIEPRSPRPLANTLTARPMSEEPYGEYLVTLVYVSVNTHQAKSGLVDSFVS